MTELFVAVLIASLVGSLHCAGMCGAFVAFAIGAGNPAVKTSRALLLAAYQAGRLVTYSALGAAAGLLGSGLDFGGRWVGVQRTAAVAAGALMVGFGVFTLLKLAGVKLRPLPVPRGLTVLTTAGHVRAMRFSPLARALATGLLTTLLPCGWLYAFVITAGGTGNAASGAALMAVFWLGTLPVLTVVGSGIRLLAAPVAAKLPAITASAIVVVGVYTIVARAQLVLPMPARAMGTPEEMARQIGAINNGAMPCCATKPAVESGIGGGGK